MKDFFKERPRALTIVFFIFAFCFLLYGRGRLGLTDPSEGRYAEISREMVSAGDWLAPQINGNPHFTKPPMTYWLTALSLKTFGINVWAARFPLVIASLLLLWSVGEIGKICGGKGMGMIAMFMLLCSPGFFFASWSLTTDFYLTLFISLACLFILRGYFRIAWIAMAGGFLTKGPLALLIPLAAFLFFPPQGDRKALFRFSRAFWFFLFALPWFVVLGIYYPDVFQQLATRSVEAFYSSKKYHHAPFWFYFPVYFGMTFPWILFIVKAKFRLSPRHQFLWAWFLFPFFFFSLSASKLPLYIFPSVIPGILLCASGWQACAFSWKKKILLVFGVLFCLSAIGGVEVLSRHPFLMRSSKPIGLYLQKYMKPEDILAQDQSFHPSLNFYTGHLSRLVNVQLKDSYHPPEQGSLEELLFLLEDSRKRVFCFTNPKEMEVLKEHGAKIFILLRQPKPPRVLLSNRQD